MSTRASKILRGVVGAPLNFPDLLSSIRLGEGMSYAEFAAQLGISRSHLCDIEKGRKAVSLDRAVQFAETLGYSKDQFVRLALQTQLDNSGLKYKIRLEAA